MEIKKYIPSPIFYRVKPNETIESIASKFNCKTQDIECATSPNICEGAFVKINSSYQNVHIVKPVETLEKIANMYNVKVETIIEKNNLKDKRLFIGQRLYF